MIIIHLIKKVVKKLNIQKEQENQKYKKELNKLEYDNKTLKQENRINIENYSLSIDCILYVTVLKC